MAESENYYNCGELATELIDELDLDVRHDLLKDILYDKIYANPNSCFKIP